MVNAKRVAIGVAVVGAAAAGAAYLLIKKVPPVPPPGVQDSINYIEYWVGGQKVTTVRRGDALEVRVVFTVVSPAGGTISLALQRIPGGANAPSGDMTRVPGTYYLVWSWTVDYTGTYTMKVDLFNDGVLVESKSFPHTVS